MLPENYLVKTNNKEETIAVIVHFEPEEKHNFDHWNYISVTKYESTNIWNIIPEIYLDYPVYEFSEWKRLLIPEKWCIRVTDENKEELKQWWSKQPHNECYNNLEGWMLSDKFFDGSFMFWGHSSPSGYNKITFEQFKQITMNNVEIKKGDKLSDLNLVEKNITCYKNSLGDVLEGCTYNLNNYKYRKITKVENGYFEVSCFNYGWFKIEEAIESMKKIIGYLAPTDLWEGDIKKGELFVKANDFNYTPEKENNLSLYIPKEIVETWEACYEKEILSKTIEIGTQKRKAEVFKDKVVVIDGNGDKRKFNNAQILELESQFNKDLFFSGFNTMITKIHIGCDAGIELGIDDLVLIIKTQKEL